MENENNEIPAEDNVEEAVTEEVTSEDSSDSESTAAASAADESAEEVAVPVLTIGSEVGVAAESDPDVEPTVRGKVDKFGVAMGTGRRKTAVARVRVKEGTGKFTVNGKELEEFLPIERDQKQIGAVLDKTGKTGKVDVWVRVNGGGITGQTGAIILGLARALHVMDSTLHGILADSGFLTRDARMVERKKFGFKKARRSFQFSKR